MLLKLDLETIKTELRRNVPGLDFDSARMIGDGFRSIVVEIENRFVFLIGKHKWAAATYALEFKLLPELSGYVTTKIPHPLWYESQTTVFPYGFIGYEKIRGKPLSVNDISPDNQYPLPGEIADFFRTIHSFPVDAAYALGVPDRSNFLAADKELFNEIKATLQNELTAQEFGKLLKWWNSYRDDPDIQNFEPTFIHGDLWYENVIVDDNANHVNGIIDFEACGVGDPAKDFAPLFYLGDIFAEAVISSYLQGSNLSEDQFRKRIKRHWQRRTAEFGGIHYAIMHNDAEELRDSILKIRSGTILG